LFLIFTLVGPVISNRWLKSFQKMCPRTEQIYQSRCKRNKMRSRLLNLLSRKSW